MCPHVAPKQPERRGFLKQAAAAVIGGLIGLVPVAAGLISMLDPLRRKGKIGGPIQVTSLAALPADGLPRKFSVDATLTDAWNKFPNVPIGAVYLRRINDKEVKALNCACPHAGCFVDFLPDRKSYLCPCHNSTFELDGHIADPKSPSPRAMDDLKVEVRDGGEVWVYFENFRAGEAKKIPQA